MRKISGIVVLAVIGFIASTIGCSKSEPSQPVPENTAAATNTAASTGTETRTPTNTPQDTVTATYTATETGTPTETATDTYTVTETPTDTATPTGTYTPTFTRTPNPCAIIGGDDLDNGNMSSSAGMLAAQPFTAASAATVDFIGVYLNYTTVYCAGLYADDGGSPGVLLATTGVLTAVSTGWNVKPTAAAAAVASGTKYWIAVIGKTAGPLLRQDVDSGFKYKMYNFTDVENTGLPQDSSGWITDTYNMALKGYAADCP